jgi:drug/metabolite transporter (DMT)-like permease
MPENNKSNNNYPKTFDKGYVYVILAAVLWAISGVTAKFLFRSNFSPFQLVQLRITIAAICLFFWLLARDPDLLKINRKDIWYFVLLGTIGMGTCQFTYLYAISKINVAAAILLQYLAPSMIAAHSVLFAHDKITRTTLIALIGATFGCYLVVGAYNLEILGLNLLGVISGLGAAVSFAWYSIHSEYCMRYYAPWTVLFYAFFFASVFWNLLHPPMEAFIHAYTPMLWGCIVYVGTMGTLVPFGLYLKGINLIRATRASIAATLEPITAGIISYLFLNEVLEIWQIIGGVLVMGAVILLQFQRKPMSSS